MGLDKGTSNLLVPSAGLERVQADDRIYTTNGYRLRFTLQGTAKNPLSDATFVQGLARRQGRSAPSARSNRLIGRTQIGYTATDDFRILPPRFRFFAGGDQSVRGYPLPVARHQGRGGQRDRRRGARRGEPRIRVPVPPQVGRRGLLRHRQRLPQLQQRLALAQGAGFGIRWRSPIGPVRADVACGLSDPRHPIVFHLNIGPDL